LDNISSNQDQWWKLLDSGCSDLIAWHEKEDSAHQIVARLKRWDLVEQLLDSKIVVDKLL
jgi:hypothetical protein